MIVAVRMGMAVIMSMTVAVMVVIMLVVVTVMMLMVIIVCVTVSMIVAVTISVGTVRIAGFRGVGGRETFQFRVIQSASCLRVEGWQCACAQRVNGRRDKACFHLIARCALKAHQIVERAFQLGDQRPVRVQRDSELGKAVDMCAGLAWLVGQRKRGGRGEHCGGEKAASHGRSP